MDYPISIIHRNEFENHPLLNRLLTLHDIPEKIYIQGTLPDFETDEYGRLTPRILTVVGSRKNTNYGKDVLEKLIKEISDYPIIILSGLALGIDGLAHKEALKNNLVTYAIPGSGLDKKVIYPSAHYQLSKEILEKGGCLMSELEPEIRATQWTFPARNRLMSAMSDAILVVEAGEKSGTLITARMSLELGKDIGAIPGSVFSPTSLGANSLIKDGASPITSGEDLLQLLHLSQTKSEKENTELLLDENEQKIFSLLSENIGRDELLIRSNMPLQKFLVTISSLEMKGYIQEEFGEVRKVV